MKHTGKVAEHTGKVVLHSQPPFLAARRSVLRRGGDGRHADSLRRFIVFIFSQERDDFSPVFLTVHREPSESSEIQLADGGAGSGSPGPVQPGRHRRESRE